MRLAFVQYMEHINTVTQNVPKEVAVNVQATLHGQLQVNLDLLHQALNNQIKPPTRRFYFARILYKANRESL